MRRADARAVTARCRAGQSDLAERGSGRVAASWHWVVRPQWPVFAEYVLGAGELSPPVNAMLGLEAVPLGSFMFDGHGLGGFGEPCGHADAVRAAASQIMGSSWSGMLVLIFRVTMRPNLVLTKTTCGGSR
jgi:hypothetical protein